jgi:hypothetical protein
MRDTPIKKDALSRRGFLGAAVSAVAGCGSRFSSGFGEFAGEHLRIFVYGGGHEKTMRETFSPVFEKETGATAILESGWWDAIAKLKAVPAVAERMAAEDSFWKSIYPYTHE